MTPSRPPLTQVIRPIDRPVAEIRRILAREPFPAFLESGPGFGRLGRWSILAACPRMVLRADDRAWRVQEEGRPIEQGFCDPLPMLGRWLERLGLGSTIDVPPEGPRFRGGLIGWLGYDLAPFVERLPRSHPREGSLPDLWFGLYDTFVIHDRARDSCELWAVDLLGDGSEFASARAADWASRLARSPGHPPRRSSIESPAAGLTTPARHRAAVAHALGYIAAGDIFQVNLAQRFQAVGDFDALDLFERLSARSPAPYSALIATDSGAVISSSPELFFEVLGDRIVTRPIKGTRPRGRDDAEDRRLHDELAASPKDRAELAMIVDLERNDLGRVCRYGSVRVIDAWALESYAQVHHRVATVEGRLRAEAGPIDVVRAVFPGGSITGAPKIRAMEIIDELEPCRRGVYTGAIGYFSRGTSAFNIAIRTMVLEGRRLNFHVGGGIVADSDPQAEYDETLHKARGMLDVLEDRA